MSEPAWHVAKALCSPEWLEYIDAMNSRYYHRQALAFHITTNQGQQFHERMYEEELARAKQAIGWRGP